MNAICKTQSLNYVPVNAKTTHPPGYTRAFDLSFAFDFRVKALVSVSRKQIS